MKRITAIVSAAVLTTIFSITGYAWASSKPSPSCASVTIAFRTRTGHEADLPVKVCGGIGRHGTYQCDITKGGIQANAKLECTRLVIPPAPAASPTAS